MPKWMKPLAIAVSVLAMVYLLSLVPRPSTKPKSPPVPNDIQRFSLVSQGLTITIENKNGVWRVTSPIDVPANEGVVVHFLASLRSFAFEEVMSRRPESFELFQVDDAAGVRLSVWGTGAKDPLEWIIGKDAPLGGHGYARLGNGKEVYLTSGLSRNEVEVGLKMWREGRLLPLAPDTPIRSIQVRRAMGNLILEKSSDTWTVNGKKANGEKVEGLVSSLRYVSADDFVDPPQSLGLIASHLSPPAAEITVLAGEGTSHILRFGIPEKGDTPRVLARRDDDPHLLWMIARHVEWLTIPEKELIFK